MSKNKVKQRAGRLGGLTTLERYGKEYYSEIGRRGALAFHSKYSLSPVNGYDFAIVDRASGEVVSSLFGSI